MPLQATSGTASYDGFGGGVAAVPQYIEDVFSTYLYTGSSTTPQTITNGIDLSGKGGLVWVKKRSAAGNNVLFDTARGGISALYSNQTAAAEVGPLYGIDTSFNADGFTFNTGNFHDSGSTYASWTFRKQPKFFDVVTYTGTGSTSTEITHNLGSAPGMVICKKINSTSDWAVWHRGSGGNTDVTGFELNSTVAAQNNPAGYSTLFTSTTFRPQFVGSSNDNANNVGATYVAYLFAHNAGGFGLTGTDNVISCGSFTTDATTGAATVNLGWEPQWILTKMSNGLSNWTLFDNMRGMSLTNSQELSANASSGESSPGSADIFPSATGFSVDYLSGSGQFGKNKNIIYIAIRRGPMKVPTSGTSVFSPVARTGTGANVTVSSGFPTDSALTYNRGGTNPIIASRLTNTGYLATPSTAAEVAGGTTIYQANPWDVMSGIKLGTTSALTNQSSGSFINYFFQRAPSFFDEVCYTGNGAASRTVPHNLTVAPELIIVKARNLAQDWYVYNGAKPTFYLTVNSINSESNSFDIWGGTATATNFYVNNIGSTVNDSGYNFVAYLFATCLGVSKVGSYTGTGTLTTINCGFTGGARYVLIKRTDASGGWYVWDTARGMVSGTDPSLRLNSTAAETNANSIYTTATGFQLLASPAADVNTNGGSYIYLAIA